MGKKHIKASGIMLSLILFLSLFSMACSDQSIMVTRVVDGDTIEISGGSKVRLIGVDTPETVKPGVKPQPFGKEASDFTKSLLEGKEVNLEFDVQEKDKYGRLLAYVYLPDGTFVNAKLIEEGYAKIMTIPPNVKYEEMFKNLQEEARQEKRGLWADISVGLIKGNINSKGEKIYHVPGGRFYEKTVAEEYFETEDEAIASGYRKSKY